MVISFRALLSLSSLTSIVRVLMSFFTLFIAGNLIDSGLFIYGVIFSISGLVGQFTSFNLNQSMAVRVPFLKRDSEVVTVFLSTLVFRIFILCVFFGLYKFIFGFVVTVSDYEQLSIPMGIFLFAKVAFDVCYGFIRALVWQRLLILLTVLEGSLSVGALSVIYIFHSAIATADIFVSYLGLGFVGLFLLAVLIIFHRFQSAFHQLVYRTLFSGFWDFAKTGISIYPLAVVESFWFASSIMLAAKMDLLELVATIVVLQRFATGVSVVYSIPNQILYYVFAKGDAVQRRSMAIIGSLSIVISALFFGLPVLLLFRDYIFGFFGVFQIPDMFLISILYLGYVLILICLNFSSILLVGQFRQHVISVGLVILVPALSFFVYCLYYGFENFGYLYALMVPLVILVIFYLLNLIRISKLVYY